MSFERGFIPLEHHELVTSQLQMMQGRCRMMELRMMRLKDMLDRAVKGVPIDEFEKEIVDRWFRTDGEPR